MNPNPAPEPIPTPVPVPTPEIDPAHKLYNAAKESLGKKLVDDAHEELGCVLALNEVYKRAFGVPLTTTESTAQLLKELQANSSFIETSSPELGAIILCATGTGNGNIPHGHVGICGLYGIMSNESANGCWKENYSFQGWTTRFHAVGGFKVHYFLHV